LSRACAGKVTADSRQRRNNEVLEVVWIEVGATKISFASFREQNVWYREILRREKGIFPQFLAKSSRIKVYVGLKKRTVILGPRTLP
jgi:hypothetical protein